MQILRKLYKMNYKQIFLKIGNFVSAFELFSTI